MSKSCHLKIVKNLLNTKPDILLTVGKHSYAIFDKLPQKRLFWDEIHPYKEGHKLIGNFLFKNIDFNLFSSNKK